LAGSSENTLSIAVLPFDNMSGIPEQDYIGDGIAENIITELSRFRDLAVIARNSSFTYKGKATRVQDIRRDLGVNYILEGSMQRMAFNAKDSPLPHDRHSWRTVPYP
jgi:adenylate cyclase